jgi:bacterioferritin-associated ferredoxin
VYVCICRVVSESRIRSVIEAGARDVDTVTLACGAGGDCGSCRDQIQSMLDEDRSDCERCPSRSVRGSSVARAAG